MSIAEQISQQWNIPVIDLEWVDPGTLVANPRNYRRHPNEQKDVMRAAIDTNGFVGVFFRNVRTGFIIDGHMRLELAIEAGIDWVPVVDTDLTEEQEASFLVSYDAISAMAIADVQQYRDTAAAAGDLDNDVFARFIAAETSRYRNVETQSQEPTSDDWSTAMGSLPDHDKPPFQQIAFTLHDRQAEIVKQALLVAKTRGPFVDTGNENSNGNAIARICEGYLNGKR